MKALIDFLRTHLLHSTLVDALEKEGLHALLGHAEDELTGIVSRLETLEAKLSDNEGQAAGDTASTSSSSTSSAGEQTPVTDPAA